MESELFFATLLTTLTALLVFGLAVACVVLAVRELIVLLKTWQTGRENRHWPVMQGHITGGGLVQVDGAKAALSHTYPVKGREYQVQRQIFREYDSIWLGHVRKILASYPVEARVQVYYYPENPQSSTLEPELPFGPFSSLVLLRSFC